MEIILTIVIGVFAISALIGKPIKIEITHHHETPDIPVSVATDLPEEDQVPISPDGLIGVLNEFMGVNINE